MMAIIMKGLEWISGRSWGKRRGRKRGSYKGEYARRSFAWLKCLTVYLEFMIFKSPLQYILFSIFLLHLRQLLIDSVLTER